MSIARATPIRRAVLVSPQPIDGYPPVQAQATLLARYGFKVIVLTAPLRGERRVTFRSDGVWISEFCTNNQRAWRRRIGYLALLIYLSWLRLSPGRINLEIDFDPPGIVVAQISLGRPRFRIHHLHEVLFEADISQFASMTRRYLWKADLICVADEGRKALLSADEIRGKPVVTLRNLPLRSLAEENSPRKRAEFGVVYFGACSDTQAIDVVAKSMRWWPKEVLFHIYGFVDSTYKAKLLSVAKAADAEERLVFHGWRNLPDLMAEIATYHVGVSLLRPVNPNWKYAAGASNKRFLLMAAGLPQISDENPGVRELVEKNEVGICVNPDEPASIADAVTRYYEDRELLSHHANAARSLVRNELNYDKEFLEMLRTVNLV